MGHRSLGIVPPVSITGCQAVKAAAGATSKKWPNTSPTQSAVVDIGPGCPTGVIAGTKAKFPTHYRDALFICDSDFRHHVLHPPKTMDPLTSEKSASSSPTPGILGPDRPRYWPGRQHVLLRRWTGRTILSLPRVLQRLGFDRIIQARYHQRTRQGTQNPPHAGRISRSSQPRGTRCRLALFEQCLLPPSLQPRIAIEWQDPKTWAKKAYSEKNDLGHPRPARLGPVRSRWNPKTSIKRLQGRLRKLGQDGQTRPHPHLCSRNEPGRETDAAQIGPSAINWIPTIRPKTIV